MYIDRMAFCGKTGQITLHFPFTIYNPLEQKITFLANVRLFDVDNNSV